MYPVFRSLFMRLDASFFVMPFGLLLLTTRQVHPVQPCRTNNLVGPNIFRRNNFAKMLGCPDQYIFPSAMPTISYTPLILHKWVSATKMPTSTLYLANISSNQITCVQFKLQLVHVENNIQLPLCRQHLYSAQWSYYFLRTNPLVPQLRIINVVGKAMIIDFHSTFG